jgi:4'-phosphopantetheinyl transferase
VTPDRLGIPRPAPGSILVLQFGLDRVPADARTLSEAERRRADALRTPELQARFVAAHAMLRAALGVATGRAPDRVSIADGPHGKPLLAGDAGCEFNLSHSADQALIALGPMPLGVDIEHVSPRLDDDVDLARWLLDPAAFARWQALPSGERAEAMCRAWTLKEAFVKARGTGLGDEPLSVHALPASGFGTIAPGLPGSPPWWVRPLPAPWGCHAALATPGMPLPLRVFRLADAAWEAVADRL